MILFTTLYFYSVTDDDRCQSVHKMIKKTKILHSMNKNSLGKNAEHISVYP